MKTTKSQSEMNPRELAAYRGEPRIKIPRKFRFASTPKEQVEKIRQVFKNYVSMEIGYDMPDTETLCRIWDSIVNEDNINRYIKYSAKQVYLAIINSKTESL